MKLLTKIQIKAVDKFQKRYNFYKLSIANGGIANGLVLDMIRYAKKLKIK